MPSRSTKRTLEELAVADDSNDDDYDDRAPGPSKSRAHKSRRHEKHARKKQKRYKGSDVESDSEEGESEDEISLSSSEEEAVETNEKGRPVRRTAKKTITYEEEESEEDFPSASTTSDEDVKPVSKPKSGKPRLIITLKTGSTPATTPVPTSRLLRNQSGSYGGKHPPTSSSSIPPRRRRSSRLSHDEDEPVIALTNSGNHVEIIRAGSHDPEGIPARAMKGGKGLKYPSKSTIDEEDEESGRSKHYLAEELEIKASQHEYVGSDPQGHPEQEEAVPRLLSDLHAAADEDDPTAPDIVRESQEVGAEEEDDDEDEGPVSRGRTRASVRRKSLSPPPESPASGNRLRPRSGRPASKRTSRSTRRTKAPDESSDFEPQNEQEKEDNMSSSGESQKSPRKNSQRNEDYDSSNGGRRSARLRKKGNSNQSVHTDDEDELAAEIEELKRDGKKKRAVRDEILYEPRGTRRAGKRPNYDMLKGLAPIDDEEDAVPTPSQRARKPAGGGGWQRSLFNIYGPFGGAGGLAPVLGGPSGLGAQGDVDSDSSDDDTMKRPRPIGGTVGMTPTSAFPPGLGLFPPAQTLNSDPAQAAAGTPANLGKIKDKQTLADADPLGVDQNVNFDSVGGLQGHIDQLKEMVSLPLLYPEIFMRFHIVPPRGVLFYGPPGTGKTLLARALASSVSSQGKKVTFYMRKGADALSKWVGEAERQLRLLFEEARKNQPSIIFFDEIDGLAPVRSSKQDQIHASIVSTLLALMDGMDGRGQVIIIGATNRPDSIDPALRRPGRFDREFYFALPNIEARRAILDIHTKGWKPPLEPAIKDELAKLTKGYGGADLRALCTEAALNAVQRRYPQIYQSNEKLLIDPKTIEVIPKDFMISVKKMVPSSQRSASSGASPLPSNVEPLLRKSLANILAILAETLPQKKKTTALEEAQYEEIADARGFGKEKMQQAFETSRVFRPRLLIQGKPGMGQQYLAAAVLNHFEGLHVQSFDLPTLHGDTASTPEATMIRLFSEVKMHSPSVIYLPNIQEWYRTLGPAAYTTFLGLLRSVKATDPILLLGVSEADKYQLDEDMRRDLFGYSNRGRFELEVPAKELRYEFFGPVMQYIEQAPDQFPEPANRKKRVFEQLMPAPPEPEKPPPPLTKAELKAQKKRDRQTLNTLKIKLQPIMDQIRTRYKKFRTGVIDDSQIRYLFDEADPGTVSSNLPTEMIARASFRPFEIGKDKHGEPGLVDQANDKFYYNIDTVTIERRLSNGYYKRPKDFLTDIKRLAKDAAAIGDEDRLLKANELLANVEVDIGGIEMETAFATECEKVYQRELAREKEVQDKTRKETEGSREMPPPQAFSNVPHGGASEPSITTVSTGPIQLGEPVVNGRPYFPRAMPITPSKAPSNSTVMTNGIGHVGETHGSSSHQGHDADAEGDTPMGGIETHLNSRERSNETQKTQTTSSFGASASAQPRPLHSYTAMSQHLRKETGMSGPLSQTGGFTPMAAGSQAADYQNDASTTQTTSGKKDSGPSSGERDQQQQQQQGTQELGPNLYLYSERRSADGSEIPDTQGTNENPQNPLKAGNPEGILALTRRAENAPYSQASALGGVSIPSNSQHSIPRPLSQSQDRPSQSQPPVPAFDAPPGPRRASGGADIQDLLNPPEVPRLVPVEKRLLDNFHHDITDKTSGLSVEQLEQVNSVLMDVLWKTRGEWDRRAVMDRVLEGFHEVVKDMQDAGQDFEESSWGIRGRA